MNSTEIIGAWPPPPGVTPNFKNPESIAYQVIIAAVVCPVIAVLFVAMRSYTKKCIFNRFDLDDYSIIVAFIFALAYSVLQIVQTKNGSGIHIWNVPKDKYTLYTKLGIPGAVTYNMSTMFTKVSILLFYLRLSTDFYFRSVTYLVMFVAVGYSLAGGFAFLYLCRPIPRYWDFSVPGKCSNFGAAFLAGAALNVATDVALLLLPIWLLQPLRLPRRQKIGVTLILMTGSFVCGVSIYRLAIIPPGLNNMDATWHYVPNITWCLIEMYTGIVCACLPSLKSFAKQHFPNLFTKREPALVRPPGYRQAATPDNNMLGLRQKSIQWFGAYFPMTSQSSRESLSTTTAGQGQQSAVSDDTFVQRPKTGGTVGIQEHYTV